MAKRPLSIPERTQWAALGHVLLLQSLMQSTDWTSKEFAFHGGTSLHLIWESPRFSEDLDFLLDARAAERLANVIGKAAERMRDQLLMIDPAFVLEVKDKSTDRMGHYQFSLTKPDVLGKAMVKAEFWKVSPTYLERYDTAGRSPAVPADLGGVRLRVDAMLPAATLASALADKLTAFATRPHLKWRDLYDHWWIRRSRHFVEPSPQELVERFLHHVSAYETTEPGDPAASLERFAQRVSERAIAEQAEIDLKPFLPDHVWRMVWPVEVKTMVTEAAEAARHLASMLRQQEAHRDRAGQRGG